jgi:hypothetical protein
MCSFLDGVINKFNGENHLINKYMEKLLHANGEFFIPRDWKEELQFRMKNYIGPILEKYYDKFVVCNCNVEIHPPYKYNNL